MSPTSRSCRVEQDIAELSPVALAWPTAIEHMLVNLLSNARNAMASRPAGTRHATVRAAADPDAGMVRLAVSDTGGGIAPTSCRACSSSSPPARPPIGAPG